MGSRGGHGASGSNRAARRCGLFSDAAMALVGVKMTVIPRRRAPSNAWFIRGTSADARSAQVMHQWYAHISITTTPTLDGSMDSVR